MIIDFNGNGGGGGGSYTLPKATETTLGGVKIGDGISIDTDGKISASGGGGSLSYKYIIPATDSEKADDTFIAAIEACGGDNIKLAELARNVALKVELNEGQGYTYFPAVDSHFWYDNVLFMCEGMNAQYFRGVYYKSVTYTGDNKGTVGTFLNGTNFGDIISPPTYKYIIPESGKVSDEFLAALQACGYDGVKLNELGRSVALQVTVRNEGEYNYFPATEVHRYPKDSGWESDRVVFICVGMGGSAAVGLVKYPVVMVEGDNAGEVGAYIGDVKLASQPAYIQMNVATDGSITFSAGEWYQLKYIFQYNWMYDRFGLVDMPLVCQVDGNVLSRGTITRSKKIDDSTYQFTGEIEINDVVYTGVWNITDNGVEVVSFTAKA